MIPRMEMYHFDHPPAVPVKQRGVRIVPNFLTNPPPDYSPMMGAGMQMREVINPHCAGSVSGPSNGSIMLDHHRIYRRLIALVFFSRKLLCPFKFNS